MEVEEINRKIQLSGCNPRVLSVDGCDSQVDCQFLSRFSRLESLLVSFCKNITFNGMFDFSTLKSLDIKGRSMSPGEDFSFAPLINLEYLDISGNRLFKIKSNTFAGLSKLRELYLEDVIYDRNEAWRNGTLFKGLDQLVILDLSENVLKRIHAYVFAHMSKLERLSLKKCRIESIRAQPFRQLVNLKYLDMSGNSIWSLHSGLRGLTRLEFLRLDQNHLLEIARKNFKNLDQLRSLSIGPCLEPISPRIFLDLSNLENLWLFVEDTYEHNPIRQFCARRNINLYFD